MAETFKPGDAVLFMKVGTHAEERLEDILKRKQREIDEAGYAMWGYGGQHLPSADHRPALRPEAPGTRSSDTTRDGTYGLEALRRAG